MSIITAVLNAIQTTFKADLTLPKNKKISVKIHAGKLTWSELQRRGFSSTSVFVTCLGWKSASERELNTREAVPIYPRFDDIKLVSFAALVVSKGYKDAESRNAEARFLTERIDDSLFDQTYELENAGHPVNVRAEILPIPSAEEENLATWLIRWNQFVAFDDYDPELALDDLLKICGESDEHDDEFEIETKIELPAQETE